MLRSRSVHAASAADSSSSDGARCSKPGQSAPGDAVRGPGVGPLAVSQTTRLLPRSWACDLLS